MNNKIILVSIIITFVTIIVQILIFFFANIEVKKRRFLLALDFLGIFLIACFAPELWFFNNLPILAIPYLAIFIVIYNLILFNVVKRMILVARLSRIKEEINEVLIEALKSLSELDYKSAYEILEDAMKKHPDSIELKNLKNVFDRNIKNVNNNAISEKEIKKINK